MTEKSNCIYDYDGPPRVCHKGHVYYDTKVMREAYALPDTAERETTRKSVDNPLNVLITGGSMGGLFTALALRQAGHNPTIYERTEEGKMNERGAGIIAHPEMLAYLDEQGIAAWSEAATYTTRIHHLDRKGDPIDVDGKVTYTSSWDNIYRNLRAEIPDDDYRLGEEAVGVKQNEGNVTVSFADGAETTGDLLVSAEGYRSPTREQFLPDRHPEYAGYVAYRGTIAEATVPPRYEERFGEIYNLFHAPNSQFLTYPVPGSDGEMARGERRINWVWYVPFTDEALENLLLDNEGRQRHHSLPPGLMREEIRQRQIETAEEILPPQMEWLVKTTDEPFVQCIYDLAIPQLVFDRVCILGDAAFFIRPHMAAGTAHAADDALTLGEKIHNGDSLPTALADWQSTQVAAGYRLVEEASRRGDRYAGIF